MYKIRHAVRSLGIGQDRYSRYSKSLINPGNRSAPTAYVGYSYTSSATINRRKQGERSSYTGGVWYDAELPQWDDDGVAYPAPDSYFEHFPSGHVQFSEVATEARSQLISKLVAAKRSDFNLSTFLAEADKSLGMITNSATRVFGAVKALRKGNLKQAYQSLGITAAENKRFGKFKRSGTRRYPPPADVRDNASNYFLEMQYGWMPLLHDAQAAAEKLAAVVLQQPVVTKVGARVKKTLVSSSQSQSGRPYNLITTDEVRSEQSVSYTLGNEHLLLASSLGLTNPMALMWEVTPLSFVIDWFIPIGDFLDGLGASHGLIFKEGYTTNTRITTRSSFYGSVYEESNPDWIPYPDQPGAFYGATRRVSMDPTTHREVRTGMIRSVFYEFPSSSLPSFDFKGSFKKAAVTAALIRQRSRGLPPSGY